MSVSILDFGVCKIILLFLAGHGLILRVCICNMLIAL